MDVTASIEWHLMKAAQLVVAARGNSPGKYVIITQVTVDPDGSRLLSWDSYGGDADEVRRTG